MPYSKYIRLSLPFFLLVFSPLFAFNIYSSTGQQNEHPRLLLTAKQVVEMRQHLEEAPLFSKSLDSIKKGFESVLHASIDVPVPIDAVGPTSKQHSRNARNMKNAGVLYQLFGNKEYAEYVKNMLIQYAALYPKLQKHPAASNASYGRLFWQALDETVWLLNTIQGYDCIYEYLSPAERSLFENNIFRDMCNFFITEKSRDFNLIHNHGTWMVAAVGMTGFVLHDDDMVHKALYGSIQTSDAGFLKQLDLLFSPDGYYTEGAYYARYALEPFFVFATAIENNKPDLQIFGYRDSILRKALHATLQMTNYNGDFLPFNDAIIGMNYYSNELLYAVAIAHEQYGQETELQSIAKKQNKVVPTYQGFLLAKHMHEKQSARGYNYQNIILRDGHNGDEGGLAILRDDGSESTVLFKFTAHGLSHGHYDKLNLLFYNQGEPIIPDYGSARWVGTEPKNGGRYLPENKSFALTTIAHNTINADEQIQFDGKINISSQYHPDLVFASLNNKNFKIICARDSNAYPGVVMQRTVVMMKDSIFEAPLLIDLLQAKSAKKHQYDIPYYYYGHYMTSNLAWETKTSERKPLGTKNGYQHLWNIAEGKTDSGFSFTFLANKNFFTLHSYAVNPMQCNMIKTGATDPNFNLREDPGILLRTYAQDLNLVSVLEGHGSYYQPSERSSGFVGKISKISMDQTKDDCNIIHIYGKQEQHWIIMVAPDSPLDQRHSITINDKEYSWTGKYSYTKARK